MSQKRLVASYLLGMMLLIHVVKCFHTHSYHSDHHTYIEYFAHNIKVQSFGFEQGPGHGKCPICDFQFIKDILSDHGVIEVASMLFFFSFQLLKLPSIHIYPFCVIALRAPPAIFFY